MDVVAETAEFTIPDGSGNAAAPVETEGEATTPVTEVAAPETDGDESTAEPHDTDGEHKKPPRGVQKRLDELTKEKYEWKREADYRREREEALQVRVDELERGKAVTGTATTPAEAHKADEVPVPENFEDYNEYVREVTRWEIKQELKKEREENARISAQKESERSILSRQQEIQQEFGKSVEASKGKHPDFEDAIKGAVGVPCSSDMLGAMMESPDGAEVMYFLAKNPAEAERIASLSPTSQIREIGKIELKLSTPLKAPEPRRITNTAEPVRTVSGAGVAEKNLDSMSMEDYAAHRMSGART